MIQLYNLHDDPGETNDLSDKFPEIVELGMELLSYYSQFTVTPQWPKIDPASNPQSRNDEFRGFWWPWHFDSQTSEIIDSPTVKIIQISLEVS